MLILPILSLLLINFSTQKSPQHHTRLLQKLQNSTEPSTIKIQCEAVDDKHDKQHHFLCVDKNYQWVLEGLDLDYNANNDQVIITVQNQDAQDAAYIAKLKQILPSVWFVQAQLIQNQVEIQYIGIELDPTTGKFTFPHIQVPDAVKTIEPQIRKQVQRQIFEIVPRKSYLFKYVFYFIIAIVVIIIGVYYWKKKQVGVQIENSNDPKQVMMTNMEINQERNRHPSAGIVRASQPQKKPVNF